MIAIDRIPVDIVTIRLEKDYLRFDGSCWYIHDKEQDLFIRISDPEVLEELYLEKLNELH